MQKVKCLVLALNLVAFFLPLVWLTTGVYPFHLAAAGEGSHCSWFHYFPGLSFIPNLQKAVKSLERVGCDGCGSPEQPLQCPVKDEQLMNSPTINATSQVSLYPLFRYRGSPEWWWWGRRTAQRVVVLSKQGHLKPRCQVLRVVTEC